MKLLKFLDLCLNEIRFNSPECPSTSFQSGLRPVSVNRLKGEGWVCEGGIRFNYLEFTSIYFLRSETTQHEFTCVIDYFLIMIKRID